MAYAILLSLRARAAELKRRRVLMKKVCALILALMLCAGIAQAEGWQGDLSPARPYTGLPEVNQSENFGYMMFYPNEVMSAANGCARLFLYVPREDVKIGSGTFYLYTEEDGEVLQFAVENEGAVIQREIDSVELDAMLWGGGTCFEFVLPRSLELGKTYFANMTRGCLVTEDGVDSPELGGADAWRFDVTGAYGVSGMEYRHPFIDGSYEEGVQSPKAGDEIRFDLVLGGDAVTAVVYGYDASVDFKETTIESEGEVVGRVNAENPQWGVVFLDAQGNAIGQVEF